MEERVLPPPDRYAVCSPGDAEILDYYDGVFESVYFLLSPFIRNISLSVERFTSADAKPPSKTELLEGTEPVQWSEVIELTDLTSIDEVDIGLRTSIFGLKGSYANEDYAEEVKSLQEEVFRPTEGDLSKLIQNELFRAIQDQGYDWLWLGDEFCSERELYWIDDLMEEDKIPVHGSAFTPDHELLVTSHWDSHFSLLCSSEQTIKSILAYHSFEGFFCEPGMTMYWSLDQSDS